MKPEAIEALFVNGGRFHSQFKVGVGCGRAYKGSPQGSPIMWKKT